MVLKRKFSFHANTPTQTKRYKKRCFNNNNNNEDDDNHEDTTSQVSNTGRHIYFMSDVTEESISKLVKIIEDKNNEFSELLKNDMVATAKPKPLYLHISSYGGDLFASFRGVDVIKRSVVPIYTIVEGCAGSGATLMSVVGAKRFITPYSYMLIHQLSSGVIGKHWDIEDEYVNCSTLMDDIYELYTENTNLTKEELKQYLIHDLWWKSDRCLNEGLVDAIYVGESEINEE